MANLNNDETMPIPANKNYDETMPISANKNSNEGYLNMDETMPIAPKRDSQEDAMDETMPMRAVMEEPPASAAEPAALPAMLPPAPPEDGPADTQPRRKKPRRFVWVLGGFLLMLLLAAAGGLLGYRSAIQARIKAQQDQIAMVATTQYQLGVNELDAGNYTMARKRFEYVISLDPSFPGAAEKLTDVMLKMAMVTTPTPVVEAGPAPTATPDLRGAEAIFNQAVQVYRGQDWNATIATLDRLRDEDITYRTLEVDGMYYIALRYRGIQKIVQEGNLEGGMYDLSQAERYGPVDSQADQYRTWARYYLTGSSFWDVDWPKAIDYFYQVYAALPNLRDGSGWTAMERYRKASIAYGDQLVAAGEYCMARDQYRNALSLGADEILAPTATAVQLICEPPTPTPAPATPTPTLAAPTTYP
jgi:tetratricopeptide (TPR) repeat protein